MTGIYCSASCWFNSLHIPHHQHLNRTRDTVAWRCFCTMQLVLVFFERATSESKALNALSVVLALGRSEGSLFQVFFERWRDLALYQSFCHGGLYSSLVVCLM